MSCRTVNEAITQLDCRMWREAVNDRGGHYNRPDGTRGPVAKYPVGDFQLTFVIDRCWEKWMVSSLWLERKGCPPIRLNDVCRDYMISSELIDKVIAHKVSFKTEKSDKGGYVIADADGSAVAWAADGCYASLIAGLLSHIEEAGLIFD